jgi:anti-anti-sigma factor
MLLEGEGGLSSILFRICIVEQIPVLRPVDTRFIGEQASELGRIVKILRKKKLFNLVIDLSGCEYISSEGLGIISACRQWCQERKNGLGIVLPRAGENEVVNLFDITGLSRSIGSALQRSVKDAVSYLKNFYPQND